MIGSARALLPGRQDQGRALQGASIQSGRGRGSNGRSVDSAYTKNSPRLPPVKLTHALAAAVLIGCAVVFKGCFLIQLPPEVAADQPSAAAKPEPSSSDTRSTLLRYRSANELCNSNSPECIQWSQLILKCEENLANGVSGNACLTAESYRESVTGIELSSAPGAYNF